MPEETKSRSRRRRCPRLRFPGITHIELPDNLGSIVNYAFAESGLEQLAILSEEPVQLNANKLPGSVTVIYVPAGVKEKMETLAEQDENFAVYWPREKLDLVQELS